MLIYSAYTFLKIEGASYVLAISQSFSQFVVAPTGCSINAMDLKIFPNTNMLLKVDCFKGFSNQNNINESMINQTVALSGSDCNNNLA